LRRSSEKMPSTSSQVDHAPLVGGTPRERFAAALDGRPLVGRVPHFELVFFLTMEAFGKVHPSHRNYSQWGQMSQLEKQLHREDTADLFIDTAERYGHDAIFLHPNPGSEEEILRMIDLVREKTGDRYLLMIHGAIGELRHTVAIRDAVRGVTVNHQKVAVAGLLAHQIDHT